MKQLDNPKSNVEAIIRFVNKGDIVLNAEQENLFLRLCYTDTLLRSRKYKRDDILENIRKRFGISAYRANQDITDAHKIFGETRKLNKNYLLSHHIDEIGMQIQLAKDAGRYELLPKLNDNYTYALNSIPFEAEERETPPAKIVYVFDGAPKTEKKDLMSVLLDADNLIKGTAKNGSYIEFEESGKSGRQDHSG